MKLRWRLEEGERYAFRKTGERRSGGFLYRGEAYQDYGDIVILNSEFEVDRTVCREFPAGLYRYLFDDDLRFQKIEQKVQP